MPDLVRPLAFALLAVATVAFWWGLAAEDPDGALVGGAAATLGWVLMWTRGSREATAPSSAPAPLLLAFPTLAASLLYLLDMPLTIKGLAFTRDHPAWVGAAYIRLGWGLGLLHLLIIGLWGTRSLAPPLRLILRPSAWVSAALLALVALLAWGDPRRDLAWTGDAMPLVLLAISSAFLVVTLALLAAAARGLAGRLAPAASSAG